MTDDLSGLEGWVEAVRAVLEEVGLGYGANGMDYEIEAPAIVLALAEPLRRAERVEQVDAMKFCPYCVGLFDADKAERHVVQCMRQAERIEELEASKGVPFPGDIMRGRCPSCEAYGLWMKAKP